MSEPTTGWEKLNAGLDDVGRGIDDLQRDKAALTTERDALAGYAVHLADCQTQTAPRPNSCTCGLVRALAGQPEELSR